MPPRQLAGPPAPRRIRLADRVAGDASAAIGTAGIGLFGADVAARADHPSNAVRATRWAIAFIEARDGLEARFIDLYEADRARHDGEADPEFNVAFLGVRVAASSGAGEVPFASTPLRVHLAQATPTAGSHLARAASIDAIRARSTAGGFTRAAGTFAAPIARADTAVRRIADFVRAADERLWVTDTVDTGAASARVAAAIGN